MTHSSREDRPSTLRGPLAAWFLGSGWMSIRIANPGLMLCAFGLILCLVIPYQTVERRVGNDTWFFDHRTWGIAFGEAWTLLDASPHHLKSRVAR